MLDAFIIQRIKDEEEERQRRRDTRRPLLEVPVLDRRSSQPDCEPDPEPSNRGVWISDPDDE